MEDIKKLMEQNEDYFMSSSDENDSDIESPLTVLNLKKHDDVSDSNTNGHVPDIKSSNSNSITSKKRNGEKRLPTRRPDPNVYNRNALLARENRRKKKEYLESIEKELQVARKANRVLAKALKRQLKVARRLEQEKNYFERLIGNRSEILTLVNALNFRRTPESESDKSHLSESSSYGDNVYYGMRDRPSTTSLSDSLNETEALSIQFDSPSNGSVTAAIENSLCDFSTFPDFFTDLECCTGNSLPSTSTTWDDVWGDNVYHTEHLVLPESTLIQSKNGKNSISDDHCYVASSATFTSIQTPEQRSESCDYIDGKGDCSNIGVFSATSAWNNQASRTPPLQLLSDP